MPSTDIVRLVRLKGYYEEKQDNKSSVFWHQNRTFCASKRKWGVGGGWETWVGDIGYCGRERLLDSPGLRVKIFDNAIY